MVSYDKVGVLYSGKLGNRSEAHASDVRSYPGLWWKRIKLRLYEGNESEYSPRTCSIGRPVGGTLCLPTYNVTTYFVSRAKSSIVVLQCAGSLCDRSGVCGQVFITLCSTSAFSPCTVGHTRSFSCPPPRPSRPPRRAAHIIKFLCSTFLNDAFSPAQPPLEMSR